MANSCKYYKQVLQVSYDSGVTWVNVGETRKGDLYDYESMQCGGGVTQYRWVDVTGQYTCDGTTKYQKTKKQYSNDGTTWQDVSPAEYGKGDVIEYQSEDCGYEPTYANEYFTFIPRTAGTFKFISWQHGGAEIINRVYYTLDGGNNWTLLPNNESTPIVQAGQKIMWKGNFTPNFGTYSNSLNGFRSNCDFDVEGNVMSLVYSDSFQGKTSLAGTSRILNHLFLDADKLKSAENMILPATTLGEECYDGMFGFCTGLTTPPQLPATSLAERCYGSMFSRCSSLATAPELPATTLVNGCYGDMFDGCTSLTTAPELPVTTLAESCYGFMFRDCTSLTTAPELPATSLAEGCYAGMFYGCSSLTTAPSLPATTLEDNCYEYMFSGCTSLNYIKCLATDISATYCTSYWLSGVSSSGTFVKNASMNDWTRGESGIPNNWTVQNA